MARLQILELPEGANDEGPPFVLVIDQYESVEAAPSRLVHHQDIAERIGARAVLVFEETIDIPANDTTAYLQAAAPGREITVELGGQDPQAAVDAAIRRNTNCPQAGLQ